MNQPVTEFEIALIICAVIFIMSFIGMLLVLAHAFVKAHDAIIKKVPTSKFGPLTEEAISGREFASIPLEVIAQEDDEYWKRRIRQAEMMRNDLPASLRRQVDIFRVKP